MSPIIFDVFGYEIHWYSVTMLLAFSIAVFLFTIEIKRLCVTDKKFIDDLIFYTILSALFGARLYYIVFNFSYYSNNILDIFKVWNGGLAIHGGIIGGVLFILYYCKKYNKNSIKIFDMIAPGLIFGQAIGRWGNFFNQEAFGSSVTREFLEKLHIYDWIIDNMYIDGFYRHPTFLYESAFCLLGFIIIALIREYKKIKVSIISGIYLIWYSIARFFIEELRTDSLMFFDFKVAQLVSILGIIIGIGFIVYGFKRKEMYYKKGIDNE
ncbi:MAG: prolipoprotein diacylglyceryl transferase [Bacilli bacterium]